MNTFKVETQKIDGIDQLIVTCESFNSSGIGDFFCEIKEWLISVITTQIPIQIFLPSNLRVNDLKKPFIDLAQYLITQKNCSIIKLKLSGANIKFYNQLLLDIAQSNKRGSYGENNTVNSTLLLQEFSSLNGNDNQIRKAKLQLIKKEKIHIKTSDAQYEYVNDQVQQQENVQQQQTQQQQQQSQQQVRQRQMEQRQQRMNAYNQTDTRIDANLLGKLLTEEDLENFSKQTNRKYLEVLDCWQSLVGKSDITKDIDLHYKITHVSLATFEMVLQYPREFKSGIHFENLPNGFGIIYEKARTILFHHPSLEKIPGDVDYRCNPLTIALIPDQPEPCIVGSVGQFFNFNSSNIDTLESSYQLFTNTYNEVFKTIFLDENVEAKKFIQPFLQLIQLIAAAEKIRINQDSRQFIEKMLNGYSQQQLAALRWVLQKKGASGILNWFYKIEPKLQRSGLYTSFNEVFLKTSKDYSHFLDEVSIIDKVCQLDSWKKQWWISLTQQHVEFIGTADLKRLWNAFEYFVKAIAKLDLTLLHDCPVKDSKQHMLLTLDRILFILNSALDPAEQAEYLGKLAWGQFDAVYAAKIGYCLVTSEMQLNRDCWQEIFESLYRDELPKKIEKYQWYTEAPVNAEKRREVMDFFLKFHQKGQYGPVKAITKYAIVSKPWWLLRGWSLLTTKTIEVKDTIRTYLHSGRELDKQSLVEEINRLEGKCKQVQDSELNDEIKSLKLEKYQSYISSCKQRLNGMPSAFTKEIEQPIAKATKSIAEGDIFHVIVITKTEKSAFHTVHFEINIRDPEYVPNDLWDYRIKKKYLGNNLPHPQIAMGDFKVNLDKLVNLYLQEKLKLKELEPYFFRYVALQSQSFSYATYQTLLNKLTDFVNTNFKGSDRGFFFPILAAGTTGRRALACNFLDNSFNNFISTIAEYDKPVLLSQLDKLCGTLPSIDVMPSLEDLLSLLLVINVPKDPQALPIILGKANRLGQLDYLYDFVLETNKMIQQIHPSQRHQFRQDIFIPTLIHDIEVILQILAGTDMRCSDPKQMMALNVPEAHLLSQLMLIRKVEKEFEGYIELIQPVLKKLSPEKINILFDLLKKVNYAAITRFATQEEIADLLHAISLLKESTKLNLDIEEKVLQHLPGIAFQQMEVAEHIDLLINYLRTFTTTLRECKEKIDPPYLTIKDILGGTQHEKLESLIGSIDTTEIPLISRIPGINLVKSVSGYLVGKASKLAQGIDDFKTKVDAKFDSAIAAIETRKIETLFDDIDGLLKLIQDPFADIKRNLGNEMSLIEQVSMGVIEKIVKKTFDTVKSLVETKLKAVVEHTVQALIVAPIAKIGVGNDSINREVLEDFKKTLLNFCKTRILQIQHDSLAHLINQQSIAAEQTNEFIKALTHLPKTQLALIINILQNNSYFIRDDLSDKWLTSLTALLKAMSLLKSIDIDSVAPKLFDKLTVENCEIRLQAINAISTENERGRITGEAFSCLLEMGLTSQLDKRDEILTICRTNLIESPLLILLVKNATYEELKAIAGWLNNSKLPDFIKTLIETYLTRRSTGKESNVLKLLTAFNEYKTDAISHFYPILKAMLLKNVSVDDQIALFRQLSNKSLTELEVLADLYKKHPCPDYKRLKAVLDNKEDLVQFSKAYDYDPYGRRQDISYSYTFQNICEYIKEIVDLNTELNVSDKTRNLLYQQFKYILEISSDSSLWLKKDNTIEWKPLKKFARQELVSYAEYLRSKFVKAKETEKETLYLQLIATGCEAYFRLYGEYPSPNQLLSILTCINKPGMLVLQIDPGQGKTLPIVILLFLFNKIGKYPLFSSRDETLVCREYDAYKSFFDFFNIPVEMVTAKTKENIYEKRGIIYGTPSNIVHYISAQKMTNSSFRLPPKALRIGIVDEADSVKDHRALLIYSESKGDPYNNLYKEFYPLINSFVDSVKFIKDTPDLSQQPNRREDINNARRYLAENAKSYKRYEEELTNSLLNRWLDSACAAKQRQELDDFVIETINRDEYGKEKTYSVARILNDDGMKDKKASWSKGLQQSLHSRLNEKYGKEIAAKKRPPFTCDAESRNLDIKHIDAFFKLFRPIFFTGTAGSKLERERIYEKGATILKLPRRFPDKLNVEAPIFASSSSSYYDSIVKRINNSTSIKDKASTLKQPALILVKDIKSAERMYQEVISKSNKNEHIKVNMHHPERTVSYQAGQEIDLRQSQDEASAKNSIIATAGEPNTITISTFGELSVGTDIKIKEKELCLLVIIADLLKERKYLQARNRTGRGDQPGDVCTVYNIEKIAEQYGVKLQGLTTVEQAELIKKLQYRLDQEALVERKYSVKFTEIADFYSDCYDGLLKEKTKASDIELVKQHKADFLLDLQEILDELLNESDPAAQYSNCYIRYDEDKLIESPHVLEDAVLTYQQKARELFERSYKAFPELAELKQTKQDDDVIAPNFPEPTVLAETHAALLYCHYQKLVSDDFKQEPYWIRAQFIEQLMYAAKTGGAVLVNDYSKHLLLLDNNNHCSPFLKTVVDTPSFDEKVKWITVLDGAFTSINPNKTPFFFTENDGDPDTIKKCILSLMPIENHQQQLLKQQLTHDLEKIDNVRHIHQEVNDYLESAVKEKAYTKKEESGPLDSLLRIIDRIARQGITQSKVAQMTSPRQTSSTESVKLEKSIKKQWRDLTKEETKLQAPTDINENFKLLISLIKTDLKNETDEWQRLKKQFFSWLTDQTNAISINCASLGDYDETMLKRFKQVDAGRKFIDHLLSLAESPIFSCIITSLIASNFFANPPISDENLEHLSVLIKTIAQFKEIEADIVIPLLLKDISKDILKKRLEMANKLLVANQTCVNGKIFTTALTMLLSDNEQKYQCFIAIFAMKDFDFNLLHNSVNELPTEFLLRIENYGIKNYPIKLLNKLMAHYLKSPINCAALEAILISFNEIDSQVVTDLFFITTHMVDPSDVNGQVSFIENSKTLNAQVLNKLREFSHFELLIIHLKQTELFNDQNVLSQHLHQLLTYFANITDFKNVNFETIIPLLIKDLSPQILQQRFSMIEDLATANKNGIVRNVFSTATKIILNDKQKFNHFIDLAKARGLSFGLLCAVAEKLSPHTLPLISQWLKDKKPVTLLNCFIRNYLSDKFDEEGFVKQIKNGIFPSMQKIAEFSDGKDNLIEFLNTTTREIENNIASPTFEALDLPTEQVVSGMAKQFLLKTLSPAYLQVSGNDANILQSLNEHIKSCINSDRTTQLVDLNHIVVKAINFAVKDIASVQCQQYLNQVKDYINAASLLGSAQSSPTQKVAHYFRLMVWQIKFLLQKTADRIAPRTDSWLHWFAASKVDSIKSFIDKHCTDGAIERFINGHLHGDVSTQKLFADFMNQRIGGKNLTEILAINTRWGNDKNATSAADLKLLLARFNNEIDGLATPAQSSFVIGDAYIQRLKGIEGSLGKRAEEANCFKDINAYATKKTMFSSYVAKTTKLIAIKKAKQITDIESEIRTLQKTVERDPTVNQNTSKFSRFFSSRNTTMAEVDDVTGLYIDRIQKRNIKSN